MQAKAGDRVKVIADEIKEGILMPNKETDSVVIKLDNGYNIGIDNKKIKEIKIVEKYKAKETSSKSKVKKDSKKPTIAILHTGGTIASKVDYKTGGVVATFSDKDFISMFPEIKEIANIKSHLVSNMMSEDMLLNVHYKKLSDAIVKEIKNGVDGIIIGHGTDTLAMTSAALSFMLENLPIPVPSKTMPLYFFSVNALIISLNMLGNTLTIETFSSNLSFTTNFLPDFFP